MEEAEPTLEELIDRRQMYRDLQKNPGWEDFEGFLQGQITVRKNQDLSLDLVGDKEAVHKLIEIRAERRALQMVLDFPSTIIETITEEIEYESRDNG